ncbi:MAG: hypothetical protein JEY79_17025 [Pseudodesulfovibrio sp.]|nr:hypothetical protein [Pseudodesulfovibrio sp.]
MTTLSSEYKDKSHHTLTMIGDANYLSKEEYQQAMNFLVDCDFIASEQVTIKNDDGTLQRPDFNYSGDCPF